MKRDRYQLVVSLGEDEEGRERRELIDRAAEKAGKLTTVWARELLLQACGAPVTTQVSRAELEALEKRVEWLEARFGRLSSGAPEPATKTGR